jgi:DNA-binding winged helix-turn-helix (wHTH) protein
MTNHLPIVDAGEPDEIDLASVPPFEIGGLLVRPALRQVGDAKASETLEPRVLKVLVALWQELGEVVARDRLVSRAWAGRIVSDDSINNCVAKLRRIGEARGAFAIETVSRVGYRLVERAAAAPAAPPRRRVRRRVAILLAALAVAALAAWWLVGLRPAPAAIAVMGFDAAPAQPAAGPLAARLRDHLTTALAAQQVDFVADAADRRAPLHVGGAVEVNGPLAEVRIAVSDRRSGTILWQGVFSGAPDLASPLPEQVTARTITALTMAAEVRKAAHGRVSPEVLRSYIQVRDGYREQGDSFSQVTRMRQVTAALPRVAMAHASLAQNLVRAAAEQPPLTRDRWLREAIAEAKLAIDLDPTFGGGYTALSGALGPFAFAQRQAVLEEGLRRAPADGTVQSFWGLFLAETGRPLEGLQYVRRSQAMDPFAAPRRMANATYYASVGSVDEARALLAANRRTWPGNGAIPGVESLFAILAASPAEGRRTIEDLARTFPDRVRRHDLWLAFFDALECRCRTAETAGAIRDAVTAGQVAPGPAFTALARLGAVDEALDVAARIKGEGHQREHQLLFAQQTAAMRATPRFMALAEQLGLVGYWRASGRWPEFCKAPGLPYDCQVEATRAARAVRQ